MTGAGAYDSQQAKAFQPELRSNGRGENENGNCRASLPTMQIMETEASKLPSS